MTEDETQGELRLIERMRDLINQNEPNTLYQIHNVQVQQLGHNPG